MVRASYIDKNGLKKGAWAREEDDKLRAYIEKYGPWNWRQLPKFAGLTRCGKSCRLRWINYLRPGVKHGNYSKEEEELIIKLHGQHGNKWALIAAKLPGRTDNDIKNYWHAHLKKRSLQDQNEFHDDHDRFGSINEKSSEEASQSGIRQNRDAVVEVECGSGNSTTTTSSHSMLLGTFSSLSQEASPTGFPGLGSDAEELAVHAGSGTNWNMVEGSLTSSFEENSSAEFWTTPFLPDDTIYEKDYCTPFWQRGDLNFIPSYDQYIDESLDFFYQAMQEMQQRRS